MDNVENKELELCGDGIGNISEDEMSGIRDSFFEEIQTDPEYARMLKKLPKELWEEIKDMVHAKGLKIAGEDE